MEICRVSQGPAWTWMHVILVTPAVSMATSPKARKELKKLTARLEELQELLYAEGKQKLLIVLQAMDTEWERWGHPSRLRWRQSPGRQGRQFQSPDGRSCRLPLAGPQAGRRAVARS